MPQPVACCSCLLPAACSHFPLLHLVHRCGSTICLEIYSCCCNLVPQNWTVGQRDSRTVELFLVCIWVEQTILHELLESCKCSISKVKSSRINMQSVYRCVCVCVCVCLSVYYTYFSVVYAYIFEAIAVSINHLKFVPNKYRQSHKFSISPAEVTKSLEKIKIYQHERKQGECERGKKQKEMKINMHRYELSWP